MGAQPHSTTRQHAAAYPSSHTPAPLLSASPRAPQAPGAVRLPATFVDAGTVLCNLSAATFTVNGEPVVGDATLGVTLDGMRGTTFWAFQAATTTSSRPPPALLPPPSFSPLPRTLRAPWLTTSPAHPGSRPLPRILAHDLSPPLCQAGPPFSLYDETRPAEVKAEPISAAQTAAAAATPIAPLAHALNAYQPGVAL